MGTTCSASSIAEEGKHKIVSSVDSVTMMWQVRKAWNILRVYRTEKTTVSVGYLQPINGCSTWPSLLLSVCIAEYEALDLVLFEDLFDQYSIPASKVSLRKENFRTFTFLRSFEDVSVYQYSSSTLGLYPEHHYSSCCVSVLNSGYKISIL